MLAKRKYRRLFSPKRRRQLGPKGPNKELIDAIVEMKRRNRTWGCKRIAPQITLAFGVEIDKGVVRADLQKTQSLFRLISSDGPDALASFCLRAPSLYEAVAQSLAAFRGNEWIADVGERVGVVKVPVAEVSDRTEVKLKEFMAWLEKSGRSPREIIDCHKIKAILGMPVTGWGGIRPADSFGPTEVISL